jgi:hypothetical protein
LKDQSFFEERNGERGSALLQRLNQRHHRHVDVCMTNTHNSSSRESEKANPKDPLETKNQTD